MSITENTKSVKSASFFNTRTMAKIAVLGALSFVLMLIEFPLPFAPSFYKLDFSELGVLIGGFALGPISAVIIEAVKIILNLIFSGTSTAGVGEFANFVIGIAFVVPASIIYKRNKSKKYALIGMLTGTLCMCIVGSLMNAIILLPMYSKLYGIPMETLIGMGTAIIPAIHNVWTFVLYCVVPFNALKGILVSIMTLLVYKHVSPILHK